MNSMSYERRRKEQKAQKEREELLKFKRQFKLLKITILAAFVALAVFFAFSSETSGWVIVEPQTNLTKIELQIRNQHDLGDWGVLSNWGNGRYHNYNKIAPGDVVVYKIRQVLGFTRVDFYHISLDNISAERIVIEKDFNLKYDQLISVIAESGYIPGHRA